nr:AAA family ATPase [Treponema sp.]
MRIKSINIKDFKRFTDLTIQNIPQTAKLVVLVGPNGCGKTSVFEAFNQWYRYKGWNVGTSDNFYFSKITLNEKIKNHSFYVENKILIDFYDLIQNISQSQIRGKFYFRSAYRNDPDFSVSNLSRMGNPSERLQENLMQTDTKVSEDYQRLISKTMAGVYSKEFDELNVKALREKIIGKIQHSLISIFPDLQLLDIGDPLEDGTFYFKKGIIEKYHYKNLSAGEKSAFDLILDLIIKQEYYLDSIFCIDEPESHMHTSLQEKVLEELYKNVPDNSQLWIATHSIGMLKKARELNENSPDSVVFLDFEGKDFDSTVVIEPSEINKPIWNKFLELAFDDFAGLIAPRTIVFCEGTQQGRKNKKFDQEVYTKIFQNEMPDVAFISIGSCSELEDPNNVSMRIVREVLKNSKSIKLVDRDDKSEEQVSECKRRGIRVLGRRHLECYLFDDELIRKLCQVKGMPEKEAECLEVKRQAMNDSITNRGNPSDDVKSASGEIYTNLKRILQLTRCGNDTHSFLRDTMAPLLTSDMTLYAEIKQCIFGE